MNKETLDAYCRKLPGCTYDYQMDWECDRYHVGGKMFAMIGGDAKGKDILTLKCDPVRADELREIYEGIIPGYHMNKTHWNSIYFDADIPQELWERLIAHAHEMVLQKLPKRVRQELSLPE
ncbi:MmcQ/YjbR family DNA-binding protein [Brevibacillus centrosporus]|uniref:MmcQ/YjbR family DNA-binding protein n=1 Tax=Brevibacillus centrosporus TaxID=54910 RepID=UPI002E1E3614|nr:MmcQ/YjbR family DNA-binding protein [Brevibacillus centrosporus]